MPVHHYRSTVSSTKPHICSRDNNTQSAMNTTKVRTVVTPCSSGDRVAPPDLRPEPGPGTSGARARFAVVPMLCFACGVCTRCPDESHRNSYIAKNFKRHNFEAPITTNEMGERSTANQTQHSPPPARPAFGPRGVVLFFSLDSFMIASFYLFLGLFLPTLLLNLVTIFYWVCLGRGEGGGIG